MKRCLAPYGRAIVLTVSMHSFGYVLKVTTSYEKHVSGEIYSKSGDLHKCKDLDQKNNNAYIQHM